VTSDPIAAFIETESGFIADVQYFAFAAKVYF
jgi:hypothetical protein